MRLFASHFFTIFASKLKECGMIEEFKNKIKEQLNCDLPGETAHLMMMPIARDEQLVMPSYNKPAISSAVLILFYPDENEHIKFPLIQRPTYNGAHSGQIGLPGGKAEKADADIIETALRETHEEIGVNPKEVEVIGKLTDLHISVSNYVVTPVIGFVSERPIFVLDRKEVVDILESDLYDIVNPGKRKEGDIVVGNKYKIRTPYFDIGKKVVWGATAMMLSELSMVISRTGIL